MTRVLSGQKCKIIEGICRHADIMTYSTLSTSTFFSCEVHEITRKQSQILPVNSVCILPRWMLYAQYLSLLRNTI